MPTFKPILPDGYHVKPFITHKTQQYEYTYSGSNPSEVTVDLATVPTNISAFNSASASINPDGIYQDLLYCSLKHLFYSSASFWNGGVQKTIPSGSQVYVLNLAQKSYGEGIQPTTFSLSYSTSSIIDGGNGLLKVSGSSTEVGHIFYNMGIATIKYNSGSVINGGGLYLVSGSAINVEFNATQTIYEHSIACTMDIGDMSYSMNPSFTGSLSPYMSTVGLFNSRGELMAVGKFPRPIKRASDSQQTVIIRFDV